MNTPDFPNFLGPLAPLYADPNVTEILVDGPDRVFARNPTRAIHLIETGVTFESRDAIQKIVEQIMALGGIQLSPANSTGEVRLPDGSQALAVIPPTAVDSPYLVIRKADQAHFTFTWEQLIGFGTLSNEAHAVLMGALQYWVNTLVVGDTRNAKNFILNLLADSLPPEERVVVVAHAFEFPVGRHPRRIHLEPGGPAKLSPGQLLEIAEKMQPDWLVVGDLKGGEALQSIQLMNSGYHLLTTLCAESPIAALTQLEAYCLAANPSLGLAEIRQMIASAFGLISFQKSRALPDYRIKITQVVEVKGVDNDRYLLQPLFTYDEEQGTLYPTEAQTDWIQRMRARVVSGR